MGGRGVPLPEEISVFPLEGALLLPGGQLPLNIFEPRYLALVEDCLGSGRMFGMVQPDPAHPEVANGPALYGIGCLGRLTAFSETEDNRLLITLLGLRRFAVAAELDMRNGYRRVRADYTPFTDDAAVPPLGVERDVMMGALRGYFTRRSLQTDWDAVRALSDGDLMVTLSMACPFAPAEKQALLEAAPDARGATLLALLQMGAHNDDDTNKRSIS